MTRRSVLRAVKTTAEQAVIDEAYRIAGAGLLAAAAAIRPGVTERSIAAAAEAAMRREGAEGFGIDTMVASGVWNTQPIIARSTHRVIQWEDLVAVTVAPRYEGYHGALGRPFLLRAAPELERIVDVARSAQLRCFEALQVGRLGWEAEAVARDTVARGETGAEFPYVGVHSIGVVEFEPPIFASHSDVAVQPGMALSIDIPLYHAPWGGFRIEGRLCRGSDLRQTADRAVLHDGASDPPMIALLLQTERHANDRRAVADAELVENVDDVGFDRGETDAE